MEACCINYNKELDLLYERIIRIVDKKNLIKEEFNHNNNELILTYSEIEQEYLDFLSKSIYSCSLYCKAVFIKIALRERENNGGKYLLIEGAEYRNIFGSNGEVYWGNATEKEVVIINEDFSIYTNVKGRIIPLTYYYLSNQYLFNKKEFNNCIVEVLKIFSEKHLLFKELNKEFFEQRIYAPIKINDVWEYRTKYELLKDYCKDYDIPKNINRYKIQLAYILIKCQKYVLKNEYQKLFNLISNYYESYFFKGTQKEQIKQSLFIYYKLNIENSIKRELEEQEENILQDYIAMKLTYDKKEKFNLKIKSIKRIINEHDMITVMLRNKKTPKVKIPKESKFKMLKLPNYFERIKNRKRLIVESVMQNNCVWSYADKINKDKSAIYSVIYEEKRYTVEIKLRRNKYYLAQISGYGNSQAPEELIKKLQEYLA